MKFTTIIPLLVALLVSIGCSSNKEYNYGIEYMHGNVKSVNLSVFEAKAKFGEALEGEWLGSLTYSFNTNHQIEQLKYYDDNLKGSLENVLKFKYDSYNNLLIINCYDYEGDLECVHECQYSNGKIKRCDKYEYYGDKKEKWMTTNYSFSGTKMIAEMNGDYDKYIYDIKYDDKGRIRQATYQNVKSRKTRTTLVDRDDDGNLLKTTNTYEPPMFIFDVVHPYFIYTIGPTTFYFYDMYFDQAENVYLYEYEFDEHRNWIKRIVYENDKEHPKYIYKRSIEYYE